MGRKQLLNFTAGDVYLVPIREGLLGACRLLQVGNPHVADKRVQLLWSLTDWFGTAAPSLDEPGLRRTLPQAAPPFHISKSNLAAKEHVAWNAEPHTDMTALGNIGVSEDEACSSCFAYGDWEMVRRNAAAEYDFQRDPDGEILRWTAKYQPEELTEGYAPPAEVVAEDAGLTTSLDGHRVQVDIDAPEAVVSEWVKRLPKLLTTALQAVCTPDCEQAQFYATHHLTEIAAAEWEAAGLTPQRPEDVLALLKPLALWGDPEDQVMLDLGISLDLTQYVLTVRFDTAGSVEDVVMMS